ncbi:nitroreductase [Pseudomonas sp. TCU-HL1]|uniref:nitroreductase n=1 Tax=Pseudomonas sp. TCU-HL1 TaxID=1856685 RepID=UPI000856191C|nr:nitroreductase [Pseudomonas sp. TCU-HL1]AOE86097.1 nitroreductase [Pseudomonas sp. TCU-HL1]
MSTPPSVHANPSAASSPGRCRNTPSGNCWNWQRAPSGNNIQPWQVHVVTGAKKQALCEAILQQAQAGDPGEAEYRYYPDQWREPYLARRREVGFGLYQALGIDRHDLDARRQQELCNYSFFDAPVGLLISLDRRLNTGSYLNLGMFIQTFMLAARGKGLHTCAQAAFSWYHEVVRQHVPLPPEHILVCGIALGHADTEAAANAFATAREPVSTFASFHGFESISQA